MRSLKTVISAIAYIENHLNVNLDLDSVAKAVNYSKYHLHRMFSDAVGLTIHDYVQRRQITEAAKLLVFSEKSILDIALLAGYESQQAFTTIFKALYMCDGLHKGKAVGREAIMARLEKLMGEGVTHNIFKQLFIV